MIGLGATGTEVAKRASAFGMRVVAVTKFPTRVPTEPSSSSPVLLRSDIDPHLRAPDASLQAISIESTYRKREVNANLNSTFVNEIYRIEKLLDLIPIADYVSLHTPLTEETRAMIGSRSYEKICASD